MVYRFLSVLFTLFVIFITQISWAGIEVCQSRARQPWRYNCQRVVAEPEIFQDADKSMTACFSTAQGTHVDVPLTYYSPGFATFLSRNLCSRSCSSIKFYVERNRTVTVEHQPCCTCPKTFYTLRHWISDIIQPFAEKRNIHSRFASTAEE